MNRANKPKNYTAKQLADQHADARTRWLRDGVYHNRRAPRFDKLHGKSKKARIQLRAIFADQKPDLGFRFPLFGGLF